MNSFSTRSDRRQLVRFCLPGMQSECLRSKPQANDIAFDEDVARVVDPLEELHFRRSSKINDIPNGLISSKEKTDIWSKKLKTSVRNCTHFVVELIAVLGIALVPADIALSAEDCGNQRSKARGAQSFLIFDGTLYRNKPDLSKHGIKPIVIIDRGIWPLGGDKDAAPDPVLVKIVVDKLEHSAAPIVLDFESYPLTGSEETVKSSMSMMTSIIVAFKGAAPHRRFGFYGTLPLRDYWRATAGTGTSKYIQWQAENDKLHTLEQHVDALFPSLYTFYEDEAGWIKYATAQICEARRLSQKPVYVFLWPEYHDSNRKLGGTPVDPKFWEVQLETVSNLADGVVIWGGWDYAKSYPVEWDENAGWWQKTKQFARRLK